MKEISSAIIAVSIISLARCHVRRDDQAVILKFLSQRYATTLFMALAKILYPANSPWPIHINLNLRKEAIVKRWLTSED